jgi:hypothetical protein
MNLSDSTVISYLHWFYSDYIFSGTLQSATKDRIFSGTLQNDTLNSIFNGILQSATKDGYF